MSQATCHLADRRYAPQPGSAAIHGTQAASDAVSRGEDTELWVPLSYAGDGILARLAVTYLETAGIAARIVSESGRIFVEVPLQQLPYARHVCKPVESPVLSLLGPHSHAGIVVEDASTEFEDAARKRARTVLLALAAASVIAVVLLATLT
jgi:hypothetical protein